MFQVKAGTNCFVWSKGMLEASPDVPSEHRTFKREHLFAKEDLVVDRPFGRIYSSRKPDWFPQGTALNIMEAGRYYAFKFGKNWVVAIDLDDVRYID